MISDRPRAEACRPRAGATGIPTPAVLALLALLLAPLPSFGQWVEDPGEGWVQLTVFHHDTRDEFTPDGEVEPFFADGHMITTSAFLTGALGLVPGVDAWAQLPLHHLQFDDAAGDRTKTGIGDVRLWLRAGPELLGLGAPGLGGGAPLPVALRAGVKLPGSEFPVDAEVIPVTEGQRDWELLAEIGHSFHPLPLYAKAWAGYRWRERNEQLLWDPGDERFAFAAVGGRIEGLTWEMAGEGIWGDAPVKEGITLASSERRIVQLLPTVGIPTGPVTLELGARIPLEGRNLPAGPALRAGLFYPVDLF